MILRTRLMILSWHQIMKLCMILLETTDQTYDPVIVLNYESRAYVQAMKVQNRIVIVP